MVFCLGVCFSSCEISDLAYVGKDKDDKKENDQKDDALSEYEELLESISTDATEPPPVPFADRVYIVISENCSGDLSESARRLAERIIQKTQVDAVVKYDNEDIQKYSKDLWILLGNTDHSVSQEAIKPLRYGDYICRWDRGHIVLGGRHDEATISAVDRFMEQVLHGASYTSLMGEDVGFDNIAKYDVGGLSLNGYDLYDFTLLYGDSAIERDIAETVRQYIVKKSGYLMNILPVAEDSDSLGKTVTFSIDGVSGGSGISCVEKDVLVYGADKYGLSVSAAYFVDELFSSSGNGESGARLDGSLTLNGENRQLNICFVNMSFDGIPDVAYVTDMAQAMRDGRYDLIIFDKCEEKHVNKICENKPGSSYRYDVSQEGYAVVYNSDIIENIKCELDAENKLLDIVVNVKGEAEARRVTRYFGIGDNGRAIELAAYELAVLDVKADVSGELLDVGCESWSYGGGEYSRYICADKYLEVGEADVDKFFGSGYAEVFISVKTNMDICSAYAELKEAVE